MKKIPFLLLALLLLLGLTGCFYQDPVLASLPNYQSKAFYTSGGFQDYTDYAKYTYDALTARELEGSKYFAVVTAEDVEEILLHIRNFEQWVEVIDGELKENYDFRKSLVSVGDYFYIKTKAGTPIGKSTYNKFDNYSVYYFDFQTQTLYYFHNNI